MTNLDHRHHRHRGVCTFLGIMLWWVKALPLIIICVVVMALLIYDFYQSLRANGNGAG